MSAGTAMGGFHDSENSKFPLKRQKIQTFLCFDDQMSRTHIGEKFL